MPALVPALSPVLLFPRDPDPTHPPSGADPGEEALLKSSPWGSGPSLPRSRDFPAGPADLLMEGERERRQDGGR